MMPEEIGAIARIGASLGVKKIKITGGEPLIRKDICEIISEMRPYVREISLTTNGILLGNLSDGLKKSGLDRINVSLHSLSGDCLSRITGKDYLPEVKEGLRAAKKANLSPIKINMVVLKDINDFEIPEMIKFASEMGATLELIELATDRSGCNEEYFKKHHFSLEDIESQLSATAHLITHNELHRRAQYEITENGSRVIVELVRSMHNTIFCANCTRVRVTSDGRLKGCLFEDGNSIDILGAIRAGVSDDMLRDMFISCVSNRKPYWS